MQNFENPNISSEPLPGEDIILPEEGTRETMPPPNATDAEFAAYLSCQLERPYDEETTFVQFSKDQEMYLYLAEQLMEKLKDEKAKARLAESIRSAKQLH